ncbi:NAD(P)-binding protein [Roridomyces roridus]|uniref:NAD(P)-binding protein n=1 Tax=Roridomyces roridus TaxID=1738132 RepID=A0AAD7FI16_9AGAR|nr:NAD(P)-binding protein [Roridomyces roridus]
MSSKGIALVTGAAQGIGRAIALRLADDGFDVAVNDISVSAELQSLVKEIQERGRASSIHAADVSQDEQVKEMIEAVVQKHGSLDVMVANAGVAGPRRMVIADVFMLTSRLVTVEEWDRIMNVNARGTFLSYKYAGLQMVKQGRGGRIIGASSLAGKQGHSTQVPYTASKFAVRGLTQSAAIEFGSHGITVNAYAPGLIETPLMFGSLPSELRASVGTSHVVEHPGD